jgi:hypothetical protein
MPNVTAYLEDIKLPVEFWWGSAELQKRVASSVTAWQNP